MQLTMPQVSEIARDAYTSPRISEFMPRAMKHALPVIIRGELSGAPIDEHLAAIRVCDKYTRSEAMLILFTLSYQVGGMQ